MSDPVEPPNPAAAPEPGATAYITYTDQFGNVHVVDSRDQVPTEFADSMRVLSVPETGSDASIKEVRGAVDNLVSESRKKFDESMAVGPPTTDSGLNVPSVGVGAGIGIAVGLVIGRMFWRMKLTGFMGLVILAVAMGAASFLVGQFLHDAARDDARQRSAAAIGAVPSPTETGAPVSDGPRLQLPNEDAPSPSAADAAEPTPAKEPARPKKKRKKKRKR